MEVLGLLLEAILAHLSAMLAHVGAIWGNLGATWRQDGQLGALLAVSWRLFLNLGRDLAKK